MGGGGPGGSEPRVEVIVKMQNAKKVGVWSGEYVGGRGLVAGWE